MFVSNWFMGLLGRLFHFHYCSVGFVAFGSTRTRGTCAGLGVHLIFNYKNGHDNIGCRIPLGISHGGIGSSPYLGCGQILITTSSHIYSEFLLGVDSGVYDL
jgi:hypothetical protein